MKEETLSFKCEQFFSKNWKYVFFFVCFVFLMVVWQVSTLTKRMTSLEKTVAENNGYVVLTTLDGRAVKVAKEPLRAEYLKQFAVSIMVNNFVFSRSQLTNNFSKSSCKNITEVVNSIPALANIYGNFLDSKADPEKGIEINKQAVGDFVSYLRWLISAIAQDKLPEYISIRDYKLDKYEYNQNKFAMELSIFVNTQSYILSQDKYISQDGIFKISVNGSFDLMKSSDVNPYGMRIERLRISPVAKADK